MRKVKSSKNPPSQDLLWREIEERFSDFRVAIFDTRFATFDQAVGSPSVDKEGNRILKKNNPSWIDPEAGPVRSWLQIPYDDKRKMDEWVELREVAKALSENVKVMLSERILGPKFMLDWGQLSEIGRLFEDAWMSEERISAATIGSAKQSVNSHKVWYAKVYVNMEKPGRSRRDIDGDIAGFVENIIQGNKFPSTSFSADWYRSLLSSTTAGELAASFQQNKLRQKKSPKTNGNSIEELAENNQYGIPPTDPAAYHL